jgi:DinB superfamily
VIDTFKELIANQYEAAFCMLASCVTRCPDANWDRPVGNLKFCQVAFHTLFFADVYLGRDLKSLREQSFHRDHAAVFADYEELEDREQQAVYGKSFIQAYLQHCRGKALQVIAAETADVLGSRPGFDWLKFSRAEVHVYNIRHIQHHAAQLSLRLRLDTGDGIPWVGAGWRADAVPGWPTVEAMPV